MISLLNELLNLNFVLFIFIKFSEKLVILGAGIIGTNLLTRKSSKFLT